MSDPQSRYRFPSVQGVEVTPSTTFQVVSGIRSDQCHGGLSGQSHVVGFILHAYPLKRLKRVGGSRALERSHRRRGWSPYINSMIS